MLLFCLVYLKGGYGFYFCVISCTFSFVGCVVCVGHVSFCIANAFVSYRFGCICVWYLCGSWECYNFWFLGEAGRPSLFCFVWWLFDCILMCDLVFMFTYVGCGFGCVGFSFVVFCFGLICYVMCLFLLF